MGAAGPIAMVAGTALDVYGRIQSAADQAKSLREQASSARAEGREAITAMRYKVRMIQEAGAEHLGDIEATTGKAGLEFCGTPLTYYVSQARKIELTAAMERHAGAMTKRRYDAQAKALRAEAKDTERSGILSGIAGALQGGGNMMAAKGK